MLFAATLMAIEMISPTENHYHVMLSKFHHFDSYPN